MSAPSNRFERTRPRPLPDDVLERDDRIPVPHGIPKPRKPSRAPLSRMERRRNLVHVQNILNEHFRRDQAS